MTTPTRAENPFDELYDYIEARQRELDRNRIEGVQYAVLVRGAIETAMKRYASNAWCNETFGTKTCALQAGHTCAHTSRSGSMWPARVLP